MEKPLYPSPYMRITQGYMVGTHKDSYAIDEAGSDSGIDYINAPFTGIVKKIYTADANEVWLESTQPVIYPDGTVDYMTMLFAHDNDISNLFVGKVIAKGERFYEEGTKGNASGNHIHMECGKGKFTGSGWHLNSAGFWSINNAKNPTDCLWVDDSIKILNSNGYTFKKIESSVSNAPAVENPIVSVTDVPITEKPVVEENSSSSSDNNSVEENNSNNNDSNSEDKLNPKLIFTCVADDTYAIKLKKGQKLYLS